jgi:hypothetical protein
VIYLKLTFKRKCKMRELNVNEIDTISGGAYGFSITFTGSQSCYQGISGGAIAGASGGIGGIALGAYGGAIAGGCFGMSFF